MIHKVIYEPIFETETLFYICADFNEVIAHVKSKYNITLKKGEFRGASGLSWKLGSKLKGKRTKSHCWFVWLETPEDLRLTVHEAGHLVFSILSHHGIKYNFENQETFCYLLDFFTYELWNAKQPAMITKKNKG
jgi:hypothetical protein